MIWDLELISLDAEELKGSGFWYLASPYSAWDSQDEAFEEAARWAAFLVRAGVGIFCPITHTHPIAKHGELDPLSHEIWLSADEPFIRASEGLIVAPMEGWQDSVGIKHEYDRFQDLGKPVYLLEA